MCVEKDSLSNGNKSLGLSGEEQGKGHKQNCLHVLERIGFPEAFDILMSTCDPTLQAESNHRRKNVSSQQKNPQVRINLHMAPIPTQI